MIVALHSRLRPGHEEAYDHAHARIPDDLGETFTHLGIREWRIWRSGVDVFHLLDCDDFEAAMVGFEGDAANERWQAVIGVHVDHFVDQGEGTSLPQCLRLVHSLREPVEAATSAGSSDGVADPSQW